jgi:tRNA (guanine-N7-)-methyltransferase
MRTNQRTFPPAEVRPTTSLAPLDLAEIFGRNASLEVDLGCGDGTFLVALAEQNPAANFLGVERLIGRVRSACRKIGNRRLTNARILQEDILYSVQQMLPPGSVDVFHLMFPDPWPKRRHQNRRILSESFLRAVRRALKPRGELHLATDHAEYFSAMQTAVHETNLLEETESNHSLGFPISSFEKRYRQDGVAIHRLLLRKTSPRR